MESGNCHGVAGCRQYGDGEVIVFFGVFSISNYTTYRILLEKVDVHKQVLLATTFGLRKFSSLDYVD